MSDKIKTIKRLTILTLFVMPLFAQLTIRAQYMKYRNSGKEWVVEVVPEGIFDGKNVQEDNMDQYYFEWRHIYEGENDQPMIKNGKMVFLK